MRAALSRIADNSAGVVSVSGGRKVTPCALSTVSERALSIRVAFRIAFPAASPVRNNSVFRELGRLSKKRRVTSKPPIPSVIGILIMYGVFVNH